MMGVMQGWGAGPQELTSLGILGSGGRRLEWEVLGPQALLGEEGGGRSPLHGQQGPLGGLGPASQWPPNRLGVCLSLKRSFTICSAVVEWGWGHRFLFF